MTRYTHESIDILHGLEGVRRKPSMYIGKLGNSGIFQLLKEAFDNGIDEAYAGRNDFVQAYIGDNHFVVHDESEGIPVQNKTIKTEDGGTTKISTLTAIFTRLHTGGKFGSHAYKQSAGTHGIGCKAITALSTEFDVWTCRKGIWYHQSFSQGEVVTKLRRKKPDRKILKLLPKAPERGSILSWVPDLEILGERAHLDVDAFLSYVEDLSSLNEGIRCLISNQGDVQEFHNTVGPTEYLDKRIEKEGLTTCGEPLVLVLDTVKVAVQLTSYAEVDGLASYVNSSRTHNDGEHVAGFWNAYQKAIKEFAIRKHTYTPKDLRFGVVGYLNYLMSEPHFSSQTKEELSSPVKGEVEGLLIQELRDWFNRNKKTTREMLDRATAINKARTQTRELMSAVSDMKKGKTQRGMFLPDVLYPAIKAKPEDRELFIVEGGSAGGCFTGDTEILMSTGEVISLHELANINLELEGVGFDMDAKLPRNFFVADPRITKHVNELIEIETEDGCIFRCTPEHRWLLTSGEYVRADALVPGSTVQATYPIKEEGD